MAATAAPEDLRRKDAVVAAVDLRDVPAGTKGKVVIVNGLKWIRYWVRFDNGVAIGSLDRSKIAKPEEWRRRLDGTDTGPEVAATAGDGADDGAASDGASATGVTTSTGVVVPQKLIDRTRAARARLGV